MYLCVCYFFLISLFVHEDAFNASKYDSLFYKKKTTKLLNYFIMHIIISVFFYL